MSLFDVLKYPISCPPTIEELRNLPEEIYNDWYNFIALSRYSLLIRLDDKQISIGVVAAIFIIDRDNPMTPYLVEDLRKRILEYEG